MPPKSGVKVKLDKVRTLRIGWRAMELSGLSFDEIRERMAGGITFETLRFFIWLGLLHEEPDLTMDDALALIEQGDFADVMQAGAEVVASFLGGAGGNGSAPPKPRAKAGRKKARGA
jgi:hypothetical protein